MNTDNNTASYEDLAWILRQSANGFFALVASPETQEKVIAPYRGANIAVYDYKEHEKHFRYGEIARFVEDNPDRDAYVLLNLQFALLEPEDVQSLNFSRDGLAHMRENFIFCVTQTALDMLNQKAVDLYTYFKLFLPFTDEAPEKAFVTMMMGGGVLRIENGKEIGFEMEMSPQQELAEAVWTERRARELMKRAFYADAQFLFDEVRRVREAYLEPDDPYLCDTYEDLGDVCDKRGNYPAALDWFQKARRIAFRAYGQESAKTARIDNRIGWAYYRLGDYPFALTWFQRAIKIQEKIFGVNHINTAASYNNIAVIYRAMGEYGKALEFLQKALEIFKRVGEDRLNTAASYNNIADIYRVMGKYGKALEYLQKALPVYEQKLGTQHPDTITTYYNIAKTYEAMGDTAAAQEWRGKADAARNVNPDGKP